MNYIRICTIFHNFAVDNPNPNVQVDSSNFNEIGHVWLTIPLDGSFICAQRLCRNGVNVHGQVSFYSQQVRGNTRDGVNIDPYRATFLPVFTQRLWLQQPLQPLEPSSPSEAFETSSHDTAASEEIWPVHIFGYESIGSPVAHLVPADERRAMTWWFVTDLLFGMRAWTCQERRILINGFREVNGARRTNHTGIKHMATNKIRIPNQSFFDHNPRFMLVPIMTPEEARDWDGRGYEAIVLMQLPGASPQTRMAAAAQMEMIYSGIFPLASNYDLDAAGELLQVMMLAIRYFIMSAHADHNVPPNVYAEAGDAGLDQHRIWTETLYCHELLDSIFYG